MLLADIGRNSWRAVRTNGWPVLRHGAQQFRDWRRGRPFWGALLLLVSGLVILLPPYASFRLGDMLISIGTVAGVSSLLIGVLLIVIGVALWLRPAYRVVGAIAGGLLSLVSLVTANLGGFGIGMLLGITGSALLVAWTDQPKPARPST